jgi:Cytochrome c554 and c-prime
MRIAINPRLALLALCVSLALPLVLLAQNDNSGAANAANDKYVGPGSCAATSCHGSVKPVANSRILQNEYSTWIIKDKHSRAYQALTGDVGERMAKILNLGKAETAPKCLACHALAPPAEMRGRPFEVTDGVTCENCHGPAQSWLGQHTAKDSPEKHAQSVREFHMVDTRNIIVRTDKCLECHLGTPNKFVDHEMIAAGHPDLFFELDSFSVVMPRHWNSPRLKADGSPVGDSAWEGVRDWSTGQAVQLRAAMDRVAWRARGERYDKKNVWPEYSELSCIACHHSLTAAKDSWRQEHGYSGRRPGDPAWNESRYVVFRLLAKEVDAAAAQDLDQKVQAVSAEMSKLNPDRAAAASGAAAAAPVAQRFAEHLAVASYERGMVLRMMQSICDNAEEISLADERAAEQATMALDSLYIAYSKEAKPANAAEVRSSINALFQQLENQSAYNADVFAASLRRIRGQLQ